MSLSLSDTILTTIKRMLGILDDYDVFDADIISHINAACLTLDQLGVGPSNGFFLESGSETWEQLMAGRKDIQAVKTFVYLTVRLAFDPPSHSFVLESYKRQLDELSWRLNVQAETVRSS